MKRSILEKRNLKSNGILLSENAKQGCFVIVVGFLAVAVFNYVLNALLLKTVANVNK